MIINGTPQGTVDWTLSLDTAYRTLWTHTLIADVAATIPGWTELRTAADRLRSFDAELDQPPSNSLDTAALTLLTGADEDLDPALTAAADDETRAAHRHLRARVGDIAAQSLAGMVGSWMVAHESDLASALTDRARDVHAAAKQAVRPALDGIHTLDDLSRRGDATALDAWRTLTQLADQFRALTALAEVLARVEPEPARKWSLLAVFGSNYPKMFPEWPSRVEAIISGDKQKSWRIVAPLPDPFVAMSSLEQLRVSVDRGALPQITTSYEYQRLNQQMLERAPIEHQERIDELRARDVSVLPVNVG